MQTINDVEYIRVSEINTFIECPAKFRFQSIDKIEVPSKISLAGGQAIHSALAFNYSQKIESRIDKKFEDVKDFFSDSYDKEIESVDKKDFEIEKPGTVKDSWLEVLDIYFKNTAYRIFPKYVERKIQTKLKDFPLGLMGTCDIKDEGNIIIDHKTTSKPFVTTPDNYIVQVGGAYCLLDSALSTQDKTNELPEGSRIDFLIRRSIKNKVPSVRNIKVDICINYFLKIFENVSKGIIAGSFAPNRRHLYCTKRFCKFANECEKVYKGKVRD